MSCSFRRINSYFLFSNHSFNFIKNKLISFNYISSFNFICIEIKTRVYCNNCLLKLFKMWNNSNLTMNICTGGILFDENSDECKEAKELRYLNSVRYVEHLCSPSQHSIHTSKDRFVSLKLMTYNVLSQTLLEEHRYLYRNASPITLKWQYRFPRLFGEIIHHNPDILCLQEVEEDHMEFFNKLESLGFAGVYKKRTGGKVDGCSIYVRANMFSVISKSEVEYFRPGVKELNRDNVGIILRLFWWAGNRHVTVANTHLLYNPRRIDVKLAQISLLLSELNLLTDFGRKNDLVFLTGDLNSGPDSKVVELITQGDLVSLSPERFITKGLVNPHNFNFKSVHGHKFEDDMEGTTFQDSWITADYIFYSNNDADLCLSSRLRLPTSQECKSVIRRLPNYASPSDHLPLVATFLVALD